jgi:hypothetical protein
METHAEEGWPEAMLSAAVRSARSALDRLARIARRLGRNREASIALEEAAAMVPSENRACHQGLTWSRQELGAMCFWIPRTREDQTMELTSNKTMTKIVRERRPMPRFRFMTPVDVDIAAVGGGDIHRGSLLNLSRTGMAATLRHQLEPNQRVAVRFHFQSLDGKEVVEELIAKVIWQRMDNTGLELETPLMAGSAALQKARFLLAHLEAKEAGR